MNEMTHSMTGDIPHRCGELSATGRVACRYPSNRLHSAAANDGAFSWTA